MLKTVYSENVKKPDASAGRVEHDSMGEIPVPAEALYGAQTQRAVENFPISLVRFQREFLRALALIKAAAAKTNLELRELPAAQATGIEAAAERIAQGEFDSHFVVDIFQTGSGTSTNMNANEVIAHLVERAGGPKVHPNDDVNKNQSSNDVIPTAIHVAAALSIHDRLLPALQELRAGLAAKADEFRDVVKIGRTHLQDAVPMFLGQEFGGYVRQVEASVERIQTALPGIYELPLGGTAVGTGLNAPHEFGSMAIALLAERTGLPFREAVNHFEAQAARDAAGFLSGALRSCAIALTKVANDVRWLASGPRCGLGELRLPAVQPGSSMMPGKVNPVIAESVLMACAQVIGHDAAIAWACASGNFELNMMMPLIAYDLLDSIELLSASAHNFLQRCVVGLEVDSERCLYFAEQSLGNATALVPEIGYEKAAAIAQVAYRTGRSIRQVAKEIGGLSDAQLEVSLDPRTQAHIPGSEASEMQTPDQKVDLMSDESFPASDPPAY
jgi:fumarate hydratase class II